MSPRSLSLLEGCSRAGPGYKGPVGGWSLRCLKHPQNSTRGFWPLLEMEPLRLPLEWPHCFLPWTGKWPAWPREAELQGSMFSLLPGLRPRTVLSVLSTNGVTLSIVSNIKTGQRKGLARNISLCNEPKYWPAPPPFSSRNLQYAWPN